MKMKLYKMPGGVITPLSMGKPFDEYTELPQYHLVPQNLTIADGEVVLNGLTFDSVELQSYAFFVAGSGEDIPCERLQEAFQAHGSLMARDK